MKKLFFLFIFSALSFSTVYAEDASAPATPVESEEAPRATVAAPVLEATAMPETVAEVPEPTADAVVTDAAEASSVPMPPDASSATTAAIPVSAKNQTPSETPASEPVSDHLEFISGEISAADESAKSITVKLYGDSEENTEDKTLTVKIDDATDITDGEKDRDLKSLTAGTEVDVEYDPTTSKATYIFVY